MAKIIGYGAPTKNTPGRLGQEYFDKSAKTVYTCTNVINKTSLKPGHMDAEYEWSNLSGGVDEPYVTYEVNDAGEVIKALLHNFIDVPAYLFNGMKTLQSVDFSDCPGVRSLGKSVFYDCTSLVITSLPESLTSIGSSAFSYCAGLALTSLPESLTSIGNAAFSFCEGLALTSLPESLTSIGSSTFKGCSELTLTSLPEGLTSIGGYAFQDCSGIALTSLPEGVTSIGEYAFQNCTKLALTSLPEGLTSIGNIAFSGCKKISLTSLPESLTSIGTMAFQDCRGLTVTSLPEGITSVGNSAFKGCTGLTNIEIKSQRLGTNMFENCTKLQNVWIRSTCTYIDAGNASKATFRGCPTNLAIYAEPDTKLSLWGSYFNRTGTSASTTVEVVYGQTECPW